MAALTADNVNIPASKMLDSEGYKVDFGVAAVQIFKNSFVALNSSGFLTAYTSPTVGTTKTGGEKFVGIALENIDNSAGTAGDLRCRVLIEGFFQYPITSIAITDVGTPVYASDDQTLTQSSLGNYYVGHVVFVPVTGTAVVKMGGMTMPSQSIIHRSTGIMDMTALDTVVLLHPQDNGSGVILQYAYGIVTTTIAGTAEDQPVITIRDTAGSPNALSTLVPVDGGSVATDYINSDADGAALGGSTGLVTGEPIISVAAGLGVDAIVTTIASGVGAAGAVKVRAGFSPVL